MAIYVNTNIASLNAQRNLATSTDSLKTSLQRLSSGLRINSAADDPAGMAISQTMLPLSLSMQIPVRFTIISPSSALPLRIIKLQHGLLDLPDCKLSINFLPKAVYQPETCIRATLEASKQFKLPTHRLMFEVTEGERVTDTQHLKNIFSVYRQLGFTTAIDDFGSGYSGLNLLATFQPHVIKLDMELTRDIDHEPAKQAIVAGVLLTSQRLGITIIAEGIETAAELSTLRDMGVRYFQGYLFARPETGCLPMASHQ